MQTLARKFIEMLFLYFLMYKDAVAVHRDKLSNNANSFHQDPNNNPTSPLICFMPTYKYCDYYIVFQLIAQRHTE